MITNVHNFQQEIAWDQAIIETIVKSTNLTSEGLNLDLRTQTAYLRGNASFGSGDARLAALRREILPLAFGSAWKILDLAAELSIASANQMPLKGNLTIEDKVRKMTSDQSLELPGIPLQSQVWQDLWTMYGATKEMRHALVHRKVSVDNAGTLHGTDKQGNPLSPIGQNEQSAFIRSVTRLVGIVISGVATGRELTDLESQLHRSLGKPASQAGTSGELAPIRIGDKFPENGQLDLTYYKKCAANHFPDHRYVDLELRISEEQTVTVELEQAPDEIVSLDLADLPTWARLNS